METTSTYWAKCFRPLDLEQTTSSIAESMNGSLKRFSSKPLASKTIANSATTIVAHSNSLLGKRHRQNEENLSKTRTYDNQWSNLNHVTPKCQKDIEEILSDSKNYNHVRFSKTQWYIWHKNTFQAQRGDEEDSADCIPRYCNVYCVETNESFEECWCSEFCKTVSRKGIPCVHIIAIMKTFHPSMVHPRWLKVYNSSLYDKCSHIFDDMIKWKTENHNKVSVKDIFPHELTVYDHNSRNLEDIKSEQGRILLQGDKIPDEFMEEIDDNTFNINSASIDRTSIEEEEVPQVVVDSNCDINAVPQDNTRHSYDVQWSYLNAFIKDLDKLVAGNPKSWPSVVNDLDNVIARQVERRVDDDRTHTPGMLVSLQLSIEKSPNGRRYKSFNERIRK